MPGQSTSKPGSGDNVKQISIVLGRFDPLIGLGLMQVVRLERSLRVIEHDLSEVELERAIREQKPEVAILDEPSTVELSQLTRFRAAHPRVGIVVLAHHPRGTRGAEIGAILLSKKAFPEDVLSAVHQAAEGGHTLVPLANREARERRRKDPQALTAREEEVREALRSHEPFEALAAGLHISPETFKLHARNVRRKLGAPTRWHLADPSPLQREADIQ
jgi:DNA-binding NarL/FixJ family response regulator